MNSLCLEEVHHRLRNCLTNNALGRGGKTSIETIRAWSTLQLEGKNYSLNFFAEGIEVKMEFS